MMFGALFRNILLLIFERDDGVLLSYPRTQLVQNIRSIRPVINPDVVQTSERNEHAATTLYTPARTKWRRKTRRESEEKKKGRR